MARDLVVVGHHHQRRAVLRRQLGEDVKHRLSIHRVQRASRFICQQNSGPVHDGSGDRGPLRLAPGDCRRPTISDPGDPEAIEHVEGTTTSGPLTLTRQHQRQHHVLDQRQIRNQIAGLEHQAHALQPKVATAFVAHARQHIAVEADLTPVGRHDSREAVQQRRLPRPRRAHQRDTLPGPDLEIAGREHGKAVEVLRHGPGGEQRRTVGATGHEPSVSPSWSRIASRRWPDSSIHRRSASRCASS